MRVAAGALACGLAALPLLGGHQSRPEEFDLGQVGRQGCHRGTSLTRHRGGQGGARVIRHGGATLTDPTQIDPNAFADDGRGFVERFPEPTSLPAWLDAVELDHYVAEFTRTGFSGGLNWYRNLDRNWLTTAELAGALPMPSLFVGGAQDAVLLMAPPAVAHAALEDHRGDVCDGTHRRRLVPPVQRMIRSASSRTTSAPSCPASCSPAPGWDCPSPPSPPSPSARSPPLGSPRPSASPPCSAKSEPHSALPRSSPSSERPPG